MSQEQNQAGSSAIQRATDQLAHFQETTEKIRARAETTAKGLGGAGTAALTAIGIARLGDIFPWPVEDGWRPVLFALLLAFGFGTLVFVLGYFTRRLWHITDAVIMRSGISRIDPELSDPNERTKIESIYQEVADLNGAASLEVYELRAYRFEAAAEWIDDDSAKRLREQAAQIAAEVAATLSRARTVLVRTRVSKAISDNKARMAYISFALGLIAFAVAADYFESKHSTQFAQAKLEAEIQKTVAEATKTAAEAVKACLDAQSMGVTPPLECDARTEAPAPRASEDVDSPDDLDNPDIPLLVVVAVVSVLIGILLRTPVRIKGHR